MNNVDKHASAYVAAIDLGSNSFHLVVTQFTGTEFKKIKKLGCKVQLAAGLNKDNQLSLEAMQRGWSCLESFAAQLKKYSQIKVRALATCALRQAHNRQEFLTQAERILNVPIELISGEDEARIIHLGASRTMAKYSSHTLLVDIGGGSTEIIVAHDNQPQALFSLPLGCVTFSRDYFPNGHINATYFAQAVAAAQQHLQPIAATLKSLGWQYSFGSSGSSSSFVQIMQARQQGHGSLFSRAQLEQLKRDVLALSHIDEIQFAGLKPERRSIFIGGLVIMLAVFEALNLNEMRYVDAALREGALWSLVV